MEQSAEQKCKYHFVRQELTFRQRGLLAQMKMKERRRSNVGIQNAPWYSRLRRRCCIRLNRRHALLLCPGQSSQHHQCVRDHVVFPKVEREVLPHDGHQESVLPPSESLGNPPGEAVLHKNAQVELFDLRPPTKRNWNPHSQSDEIEKLHLPLR